MAKVILGDEGLNHLRGANHQSLCGAQLADDAGGERDDDLTCPACAAIALRAVELVTKAEKRLWRSL